MRKLKYIFLAILLISLSVSSFPHILGGFASTSPGELKFLETYSFAEITAQLDSRDPFHELIQTEDVHPSGSKLGFCPESQIDKAWEYIHTPGFLEKLPADVLFAWGADQGKPGKELFVLREPGKAYSGPLQSDIQGVEVADGSLLIIFSEAGGHKFETLTGENVGKDLAIVIMDQVYAAPRVREAIAHGKCMISGNFSDADLQALKSMLE